MKPVHPAERSVARRHRGAERRCEQRARRGKNMSGRHGRDDDQIDVCRVEPGCSERLSGSRERQIARRLAPDRRCGAP